MKVFILCGGKGSRMYPFTIYENKCLLRIGGYPVARIIADNIINKRIVDESDINIICKPIDLKDFLHEFRDTQYKILPLGINVPKGTAGDFMSMFDSYYKYRGRIEEGEDIMIHYGDVLTNLNYSIMMQYWYQNKSGIDLLLIGNSDIKHDYSKITTRMFDEVVRDFWEKPYIGYTSWTGIMIFPFYEDRGLFPFLRAKMEESYKTLKEIDFAYDIFPEFIKYETTLLYTNLESDVKWYDMGHIRSYENVRAKFTESNKSPLQSSDY